MWLWLNGFAWTGGISSSSTTSGNDYQGGAGAVISPGTTQQLPGTALSPDQTLPGTTLSPETLWTAAHDDQQVMTFVTGAASKTKPMTSPRTYGEFVLISAGGGACIFYCAALTAAT